jgi:hypothetical protein
MQASSLVVQPAFELGALREEQSLQEVTPIELESRLPVAGLDRLGEGHDVTPQTLEVDPQLPLTTALENLARRQAPLQEVHGLTERRPGPVLIQLRPEKPKELVPPLEARSGGARQVGQEGEALGLGKDRPYLATLRVAEIGEAEQLQPDPRHPAAPSPA